jgi:fatty acid desaturase
MLARPVALESVGTYAELRHAIVDAGLLRRAYGYYAWRTVLSFLLLGAALGAAYTLPVGPGALVLNAILVGFGSVQVGLIGHDAGHLAVLQRRRTNLALGWVCWSVALGVSFWYWFDRHSRHHANTNEPGADPDMQWVGPHRAALGVFFVLGLALAFRVEGWRFAITRLRGMRRVVELGVLCACTLAWASPILVTGWWWAGAFLLGQILAGTYLALVIAPNHKGMPTWADARASSFLDRQVRSSRNICAHPVTDFVFGGLNYQIEHHLFPTMPRVHFCRARAIVRPFCVANGLPYTEMSPVRSYRLVFAELRSARASGAWLMLQADSASASSPTVK